MLHKIVMSQDRKNARVYFDTHSVGLYHSDGKVEEIIDEVIFKPARRMEERLAEAEARLAASLEDTQVIELDPQLSFKVAA